MSDLKTMVLVTIVGLLLVGAIAWLTYGAVKGEERRLAGGWQQMEAAGLDRFLDPETGIACYRDQQRALACVRYKPTPLPQETFFFRDDSGNGSALPSLGQVKVARR